MDETEVDGPDVASARSAKVFAGAKTGEVAIAIAESKRLSSTLLGVGARNHFAEKFRLIIQGG